MLEKLKKLKESKALKFIGNILYTIMIIFVVLMLLIVIIQRTSNNNVSIGGIRMFTVATGSMIPVYEVGDVLIAKEIEPEKIEVGDDIVYMGKKGTFTGKIVTHRVISIESKEDGNYKIVTQGVANNAADPEIDQTQVYGKIIYNVKILGVLSSITRNKYIFYIIIFIPVGILIYKNIKNIKNMNKDNKDEDEENKE